MIAETLATALRCFTGARASWSMPLTDTRSRIFFANHTSHLDFVVLWSVLPPELRRRTRPTAARDYWSRGKLRPWLAQTIFRAALIERERVTRANHPVEALAAVLAEGDSVILFPEGTRGPGPEVGVFKSGLFHLARRHPDVDLVPVYIENSNRVLPKGELLPIPLICRVNFGAPLKVVTDETKEAFLGRAREAVVTLRS